MDTFHAHTWLYWYGDFGILNLSNDTFARFKMAQLQNQSCSFLHNHHMLSRKGPDATRASEASRPAGRYNAISLVANLIRTLGKSEGTNVHLSWGKFDRDSRKMCPNSTYVVYASLVYAHSLWANLIVMSMETKLYFETENSYLEASLKQDEREKKV